MLKRFMHIMALLAFAVSTMPSLSTAMPMMDQSDGQHKQHQPSADMKADHSHCNKQKNHNKNKDGHRKCCGDDCQCMMNGCAKTQSLHHTSTLAFAAASEKLLFITSNQRDDDSIAYLLKRPPKV